MLFQTYINKHRRKAGQLLAYRGIIYNGVDYSSVYDYNYYINLYPDIRAAFGNDDRAVLAHFINYGMTEGRRGNATFDVAAYRNKYADLQQAFGNDWKGYYEHYVQYGLAEGR